MNGLWIYYLTTAIREAASVAAPLAEGRSDVLVELLRRLSNDFIVCFQAYDGMREQVTELQSVVKAQPLPDNHAKDSTAPRRFFMNALSVVLRNHGTRPERASA
jgi:hypothetical protein